MFIGIGGALLAVIGLAAMLYPIYLDCYDGYGIRVSCGNGFNSHLSQAADSGGHDVVTQCGSALLVRRAMAIPAVAIGWLLVTGFLVSWVHNEQRKRDQAEPSHYVPHPEIAGTVTGRWTGSGRHF
jgi:hypothetical protein